MHGESEGVGQKKQGERKSLTHKGHEPVLWNLKKVLITLKHRSPTSLYYTSVFIWLLVQYNMWAYKAEVRLSISSCEMQSAHLECV